MNLPPPDTLACVARPLEVVLCDQQKVLLQVIPAGQEPPERSDALVVQAVLYLPAGTDHYLVPELRFSERLHLLGAALTLAWGRAGSPEGVEGSYRQASKEFVGRRWDRLLRRAVRSLYAEVRQLNDALQRRQAKLRVLGWEYYAARQGILPVPVPGPERPKRHIVRTGSREPEVAG